MQVTKLKLHSLYGTMVFNNKTITNKSNVVVFFYKRDYHIVTSID